MKTNLAVLFLLSLILFACTENKEQPIQETISHKSKQYQASQPLSFSIPKLQESLASGELSSEELVRLYTDRIKKIDRNGPHLHAIISINQQALAEAKRMDELREQGKMLGSMHGIPILIKDNIETKELPTTAGALVLKDNFTGRDAPLIANLRAQGAIILGKTNLSQWANFRSHSSMSGWSALGGQVNNPHVLGRNPCGSSSGSAVAIAASLAAGAVGTETNGSIICPSHINGIVGFKPSLGLVSQKYIIPIAHSQDTAGPMSKTVMGAAIMLGAMDGIDVDYTKSLKTNALAGVKIGVMRFAQGGNKHIIKLFDLALEDLQKSGAELVFIDRFDLQAKDYGRKSLQVLEYEFRQGLNRYLADSPANLPVRSLAEIIEFNTKNKDRELVLFDQSIFIESQNLDMTKTEYKKALSDIKQATGKNGIDYLLSKYNVHALISPSGPLPGQIDAVNGDVWPEWVGAGYLAAVAGYPHISVPMGDVYGLPVGLSFIGAKGDDAKILGFGYAYEQVSQRRVSPKYRGSIDEAAKLKPLLHSGD